MTRDQVVQAAYESALDTLEKKTPDESAFDLTEEHIDGWLDQLRALQDVCYRLRKEGITKAVRRTVRTTPVQASTDTRTDPKVVDAAVARLLGHHRIGEGSDPDVFVRLFRMAAAAGRIAVKEAAGKLCMSARALHRQLTSEGFPPPHFVLAWGELVRAMSLYRRGITLQTVARACQVLDGSTLSARMLGKTGLRPTEWRDAGGDLRALIDAMVDVWQSESDEAAA